MTSNRRWFRVDGLRFSRPMLLAAVFISSPACCWATCARFAPGLLRFGIPVADARRVCCRTGCRATSSVAMVGIDDRALSEFKTFSIDQGLLAPRYPTPSVAASAK
jgi:hypothetical protein